MLKTCLPCNLIFNGDVCENCLNPDADYVELIEKHKGFEIKKYSYETGYRVDFGTKRSIMMMSVEAARKLIDLK